MAKAKNKVEKADESSSSLAKKTEKNAIASNTQKAKPEKLPAFLDHRALPI